MFTSFPAAVYLLCFLTSAACAFLLARSYRRAGARLLFWSALCFLFLAVNNLVVIIDLLLLPDTDFRAVRHGLALAALGVLLFGFIWDLEE
ncbi:MAG TPA: DUF5985 family protein [Allosphingosinicella sp.]|nr:DUF5985 family protein [Allosphingosinicella sp.]